MQRFPAEMRPRLAYVLFCALLCLPCRSAAAPADTEQNPAAAEFPDKNPASASALPADDGIDVSTAPPDEVDVSTAQPADVDDSTMTADDVEASTGAAAGVAVSTGAADQVSVSTEQDDGVPLNPLQEDSVAASTEPVPATLDSLPDPDEAMGADSPLLDRLYLAKAQKEHDGSAVVFIDLKDAAAPGDAFYAFSASSAPVAATLRRLIKVDQDAIEVTAHKLRWLGVLQAGDGSDLGGLSQEDDPTFLVLQGAPPAKDAIGTLVSEESEPGETADAPASFVQTWKLPYGRGTCVWRGNPSVDDAGAPIESVNTLQCGDKTWQGLGDLIAIMDLDGSGLYEVVFRLNFEAGRSYSARFFDGSNVSAKSRTLLIEGGGD